MEFAKLRRFVMIATLSLVLACAGGGSGNSGGSGGSPTQPSPPTQPTPTVQPVCEPIGQTSEKICLKPVDTAALGNRTPVILIHGWNNAQPGPPSSETWDNFLAYAGGISWVGEKFKFYQLTYYSNLVNVPDLAKEFAELVDEMGTKDTVFANRQFIIISYSMGGLVARSFMEETKLASGQSSGERVLRLITLATPHHGTPVANGPSRDDKAGSFVSSFINFFDDTFFGGVSWGQYNRYDLRYDGYVSGELDYNRFPQDKNIWLEALNARNSYWNKLSAYAGMTDSSSTLDNCVGLNFSCLSFLVYKIFKEPNDGVVPRHSALALPYEAFYSEPLNGYNHFQMAEGRTPDDSYLFGAILGDLSDFAYVGDSRFGSSVSLGSAGEEFHNLRGWAEVGRDGYGSYRDQASLDQRPNSVDLFVPVVNVPYTLSFERRDGGCNRHFVTFVNDFALELFLEESSFHCSSSQGVSRYQWDLVDGYFVKKHRARVAFLDPGDRGEPAAAPTYGIRLDPR